MSGLTARVPRHRLRPLLAAAILPALTLLCSLVIVRPHPAQAFSEWCFDDPVVKFNGIKIHNTIGVNGPRKAVKAAIASTTLTYQVPAGGDTEPLSARTGFLNPRVQFVTSNVS